MVREQLAARGVDRTVLDALARVRRHCFVQERDQRHAYADGPLPIECGQTISQPYVVALMTELVGAQTAASALDVGTGSGYQAAVLAELVPRVYSVERVPELAHSARARLEGLGYDVEVRCGDGTFGWPERAAFDAIVVACAAEAVPSALVDQLTPQGRLVLPVGSAHGFQELVLVERSGDGAYRETRHGGVAFVPMVAGPVVEEDS